jgi:hypothetical protein
VAEHKTLHADETHRLVFRALELDKVRQFHHLDRDAFQIHANRGFVVKRAGFRVVEPFAGRIEFLKDVLHHAKLLVHAHLAVVLPAAFVGDGTIGVPAGDAIVVTAPAMHVHGVDVTAGGIRPTGGAFLGNHIRRKSLISGGRLVRIKIRIACHVLAATIDEQLIERHALRRGCHHDAVAPRLPVEGQFSAATDHRLAFVHRPPGDGMFRRAGIRCGENQRFRKMIDAIGHKDRDGLPAGDLPCGITRRRQGPQRSRTGSSIGVLAIRSNMKFRSVELGQECHHRDDGQGDERDSSDL